jgi:hypothetical protein
LPWSFSTAPTGLTGASTSAARLEWALEAQKSQGIGHWRRNATFADGLHSLQVQEQVVAVALQRALAAG